MTTTQRVVVGMDPHKRSVTIEVMTGDEEVLSGHRFSTDLAGFKAMTEFVMQWPDRVWAPKLPKLPHVFPTDSRKRPDLAGSCRTTRNGPLAAFALVRGRSPGCGR